ncbi:hypothetical protein DL98DRAFT_530220 [Cadophora sp. DSE1049]|nr:hypothetical protein DL98DRAFT_530220 [Cadophora sp. DSE1049]
MSLDVLNKIMRACPCIVDLAVDMPLPDDTHATEIWGFLRTLAESREFQHLVLQARRTLQVEGVSENSIDPTFDGASKIMEKLHQQKLGHPFKQVMIHLDDEENADEHEGEEYDPNDHHIIRRLVSHKLKDGKCGHDGVYQQWGSKKRTAKWGDSDGDEDGEGSLGGYDGDEDE